jgi:hypothetical protein
MSKKNVAKNPRRREPPQFSGAEFEVPSSSNASNKRANL